MTRWTVVIADDEPAARRGVRQLLAAYPEFAVAGEARNGAEALASLDTLEPDLLFLDVQMPGLDGFEVIRRRTPERMPVVVFLTAYDQFAVRAFEAQALDYLVKPVTEARFAATIKRVVKTLQATAAAGEPEQPIVVTTAKGATVLRIGEIDWIESADNYARIWTGGRSYLLRESMRELEQRVGRGFVRAHRRALVRVNAVREMKATGGGVVAVLGTGATIPVSRRLRASFTAAVKGQMQR